MTAGRNFLLGIIAALVLWVGGIADAMPLARLQQQAVVNRRVVEKYRVRVRQGALSSAINRSYFWPSLDLSYTTNTIDESTATEFHRNSAFRGAISYNLFAGFRDRYNLEAAELAEISLGHELQAVIQDLYLTVALRYLDLFTRREQLAVSDDAVTLLEKRLEDVRIR